MEERYLSLSEAADALDISERTAYRWINSGKLRAYKPGRDYRIPESAIREAVEESKVRPKASGRSSLEPSLFNGFEDERLASSWVFSEALITTAERLANSEPPTSLADVLKRFGILEVLYSVAEPLDELANDPKAWEDLGEERLPVSRVGYTLHQAAKQILERNNEYLEHEREDRQASREAEAARGQMREWTRRLSA